MLRGVACIAVEIGFVETSHGRNIYALCLFVAFRSRTTDTISLWSFLLPRRHHKPMDDGNPKFDPNLSENRTSNSIGNSARTSVKTATSTSTRNSTRTSAKIASSTSTRNSTRPSARAATISSTRISMY